MTVHFGDLFARPIPEIEIDVPEWGGSVKMRRASTTDLISYLDLQGGIAHGESGEPIRHADALRMAIEIIAISVLDGESRPLSTGEGRDFLARQSIDVLNLLSRAALEINGLTDAYDAKKN